MSAKTAGVTVFKEAILYHEEGGEGFPLVLVSGSLGLDTRMWDDVWDNLTSHYRVYRYDPRGIGRSSVPTSSFSHTQDLRTLLRHWRLDQCVLVGVASAANIAVAHALDHPEQVKALVLISPALGDASMNEDRQNRWARIYQAAQEKGLERAVDLFLKTPTLAPSDMATRQRMREILLAHRRFPPSGFMAETLSPELLARLTDVSVPTLIISGTEATDDSHIGAQQMAQRITDAQQIDIPQTGQLVVMEAPKQFVDALRQFLMQQGIG